MAEQIFPQIYRVEIPLPNNPLRALNSYIIKGLKRNLIIDTGMNRPECMAAMQAGLKELNIDLAVSDFFITHMHADHSGLAAKLATDTSRVYCSQIDANIINFSGDWEHLNLNAYKNGFPPEENALSKHPGFKYRSGGGIHFSEVADGDVIEIGDYRFQCVATPGHTRGHLCLYEPTHRLMLSGDHILATITPNITLWTEDYDPLEEYLQSLDKVYAMDVDLILPGHREVIHDHRCRIEELKHHHANRCANILSVLNKGSKNAYQIASQVKWDLTFKHWDEFPVAQKWFATGEVVAHLKHLEQRGILARRKQGDIYEFALAL